MITATILVLAIAAGPVQGSAPDLSGIWKVDPAKSTSTGGGRGGGRGTGGGLGLGQSADQLTIRQDGKSLTIDERRGEDTARLVYALDGRRVQNKVPAGKNAGVLAGYQSRWNDGRLVTTIVIPATADAAAISYEEARYLNREGALIVETAILGQQNARRVVYVKQR